MAAPRHRRESVAQPLTRYEPQIPLRSLDFDAVAPMRKTGEQKKAPAKRDKSHSHN